MMKRRQKKHVKTKKQKSKINVYFENFTCNFLQYDFEILSFLLNKGVWRIKKCKV